MALEVVPSDQSAKEAVCDALIVTATSREGGFALSESAKSIDDALDGYLSEYLNDIRFKADVADVASLPTHNKLPARTVVVAGLGSVDDPDTSRFRRAAAAAIKRLSERPVVAADFDHRDEGAEAAAVEGLLLATHRGPTQKRDPKLPNIQRIDMLGAPAAAIDRGKTFAEATICARDLVNEPASVLDPETLAERARHIGEVAELEVEILGPAELEKQGFGGILAVARGSTKPPQLISLNYRPPGAREKVVLVGKGVTFDSGGLSLKTAQGMETMKTDMGGGAAVIGTMSVLPRLAPDIAVTGLIPATENMPSGDAVKPGDVITHYGGRTTEVLNTDAEGRLILADALALASEQDPKAIIDVATLTGSMSIALGHKMTGAFSNDDDLWSELAAAAAAAGEPMWRLPLVEDYKKSLDSDVADMKNVGGRYGGAIVAALFLREFVGPQIPWVHLDIAGTGRSENGSADTPKGGTGVATRTLLTWVERRGG